MTPFKQHIIIGDPQFYRQFETPMPVRIEQGGLFLCQSGEADIVIDMKQYRIRNGSLVVAFPYSVIQMNWQSDDFGGWAIGAQLNFFSSIQIPAKSSYYLNIKENPCIQLTEDEWRKIISLHDIIVRENEDQSHPLRNEIDDCLLRVLAYEIAAIYLKRKPITQQPQSRKDMIFQQFVFSLFNNFQVHRSLDYYAMEQSITPRHLSMVVKSVSGQTAGDWIVQCVIANIKSRLQDETVSIHQIADEMNFPNASFFAQYFKKYTGISPREYRATLG